MSTANFEKFNPEAERQASQVAIGILTKMVSEMAGVAEERVSEIVAQSTVNLLVTQINRDA